MQPGLNAKQALALRRHLEGGLPQYRAPISPSPNG